MSEYTNTDLKMSLEIADCVAEMRETIKQNWDKSECILYKSSNNASELLTICSTYFEKKGFEIVKNYVGESMPPTVCLHVRWNRYVTYKDYFMPSKSYYCYKIYYATNDYGGNVDERLTKFPVLDTVCQNMKEANEWLECIKKQCFRGYEIKPTDFAITTEYEQYSYPEMA